VLSGVLHGSVLGPLLFNIFINDLCDVSNHSNCILFADDLKDYRAINSPRDSLLLQSDTVCVHEWCSANSMKPKFREFTVISFTRKKNVLNYQYRLENSFILRNDCIKDLGVIIECKLHVDFLFSQ
jgi:hypothetical protein